MNLYQSPTLVLILLSYIVGTLLFGVIYDYNIILQAKLYEIWLWVGAFMVGIGCLGYSIKYVERNSVLKASFASIITTTTIFSFLLLFAFVFPDAWHVDVTYKERYLSIFEYTSLPSGAEVSMYRYEAWLNVVKVMPAFCILSAFVPLIRKSLNKKNSVKEQTV